MCGAGGHQPPASLRKISSGHIRRSNAGAAPLMCSPGDHCMTADAAREDHHQALEPHASVPLILTRTRQANVNTRRCAASRALASPSNETLASPSISLPTRPLASQLTCPAIALLPWPPPRLQVPSMHVLLAACEHRSQTAESCIVVRSAHSAHVTVMLPPSTRTCLRRACGCRARRTAPPALA